MTTIINGSSPSITFSDSTTQASAGLTSASPTITSGVLTFPNASTQSAAGLVVGSASAITSGTAVASTSGTSIDFTSIPSWVKRITVMFNGVSTNGSSNQQIQIGAGSVDTSGYAGACGYSNASSTAVSSFTAGFGIVNSWGAANNYSGSITLTSFGSNIWVASGVIALGNTTNVFYTAGTKTLSGTLDRVRITTANGTDTFDAGSINILYE